MGQDFYFINQTTKQRNKLPCPWNYGFTWARKMNLIFIDKEIKEIFIYMININNWNVNDNIIAEGDCGDTLYWKDYKHLYDETEDLDR